MNNAHAGNYPLEQRTGEIERLLVQAQAMAPDTLAMLDRIGPMQGWRCIDVGCGKMPTACAGFNAASTPGALAICNTPLTARTANHKTITGPKRRPTRPVPPF